jgi:hypothetical protein
VQGKDTYEVDCPLYSYVWSDVSTKVANFVDESYAQEVYVSFTFRSFTELYDKTYDEKRTYIIPINQE